MDSEQLILLADSEIDEVSDTDEVATPSKSGKTGNIDSVDAELDDNEAEESDGDEDEDEDDEDEDDEDEADDSEEETWG